MSSRLQLTSEPNFRLAGYLIRRMSQVHDAIFADQTSGFAITAPQLATIGTIARHPGIELMQLAELVGYDGATLGGLINRLTIKKLVRRAVGKRDRRTRQLFLTEKGRGLLEDIKPKSGRVHDLLLAALTPEERDSFVEMMQRIVLKTTRANNATEGEVA